MVKRNKEHRENSNKQADITRHGAHYNLAHDAIELRHKENAIKTAYGDFLRDYKWSHFVHLTFRWNIGADRAHSDFLKWIRRIEQRSQRMVSWFDAIECGSTGMTHVHALVYAPSIPTKALCSEWKSGLSGIVRYQPEKGATHYITKDILRQSSYYDISHRLRALSA